VIREASVEDADRVVEVINISNYVHYRDVIPSKYFKQSVVNRDEILGDMRRMKFYVYEAQGRIIGTVALQLEPGGGIGIV